jgi:hypothetical protein
MIKFGVEKLSMLWEEVFPLLNEHYKEVSKYHDIKLDPDVTSYKMLEDAGALAVYTARKDTGELVGYAAYVVRMNMHYQSSCQAMQDVIFLAKEYRQGMTGYKLIKYADERLQELGIQVVYHHVKEKLDFGPVLKRLGYEPVERIWARRLDK